MDTKVITWLEPTSNEYNLLAHIVMSPFGLKRVTEEAQWLDEVGVGSNEINYKNGIDSLNSLLSTKMIEVLDEAAIAWRRKYIAGGPPPLDSIRCVGQMDVTLAGAAMFERGFRKISKHPDERKLTFFENETGHVSHWHRGMSSSVIELPYAELIRQGDHWIVRPTSDVELHDLVVRENILWRDRWWQVPQLGLNVEYSIECDEYGKDLVKRTGGTTEKERERHQ